MLFTIDWKKTVCFFYTLAIYLEETQFYLNLKKKILILNIIRSKSSLLMLWWLKCFIVVFQIALNATDAI
jgi:hypothetical protein